MAGHDEWTLGTAALASLLVGVSSLLPTMKPMPSGEPASTSPPWRMDPVAAACQREGELRIQCRYKNGPDSPCQGEFNLVDHGANVTIKDADRRHLRGEGNGPGTAAAQPRSVTASGRAPPRSRFG